MKKSTRFLALLLCLVMVATLMPTFALAAGVTVVDNKGEGKDILTLSTDRYSVKTDNEIGYTDGGYGYETTYLIPRGTGTKTFTITRNAYDINRWWRWGIEGTLYSQAKSNEEVGYSESWTTGVDGMDANIVWVTRENTGFFKWEDVTHYMEISKDSQRDRKYIVSKVINRYEYRWAGGSEENSAKVEVSVNRALPLGTSSVLWSANGTDEKQIVKYGSTVVHATKDEWVGIIHYDEGHYVNHGDPGQNFIRMAEPRYVTYQLDGGKIGTDPNDQQYLVWTTGTAKTSQKHKVITDVPTKQGMIFDGWYCNELGKMVTAGADLNNGITQNMTLVAQWKNDIEDPDYFISFNGNGNTNTGVTMPDQEMEFDVPDTLSSNKFLREFTVNYNENYGTDPTVLSDVAKADFLGWGTSADSGAVYGDREEVNNLTDVQYATVPLYAQWKDGSVILPNPEREVTEDDADDGIVGWRLDGWFTAASGGSLIGLGGASYTPTGDTTMYAHWTAIKNTKYYVVHIKNGVAGSPTEYDTEKNPNLNLPSMVSAGYLYGGTFIDEGCTAIASENPMNLSVSAGATYYIKEVLPYYLQPQYFCVYDHANNNRIVNVYLITGIDDNNYKEVGFNNLSRGIAEPASSDTAYNYFTVNNYEYTPTGPATTKEELAGQIERNKGEFTGTGSTDFSFADIFGVSGKEGLLYVAKTGADFAFSDISYTAYYITQDNVKVTGNYQRNISAGNGTYTGGKAPGFTGTLSYVGAKTEYVSSSPSNAPKAGPDSSPAKAMLSSVAPKAELKSSSAKAVLTASAPKVAVSAKADNEVPAAPAPEVLPKLKVVDSYSVNSYISDEVAIFGITKVDNGVTTSMIVPQGDNTGAIEYAGKDGYFFAGWFNDEAYTEPSDFSNVNSEMTTYAKYVAAKNVKESTVKSSLKLSTVNMKSTVSAGDNKFQEIGVIYNVKGADTKVAATQTVNKVNTLLNVFGGNRSTTEFAANFSIKGLANNSTFTVTPYWVTFDGTTVYGNPTTYAYRLGLIVQK